MEDAGVSLSPEIDIGQVEGAFVMGLGYYTLENLVYDKNGALLTNRTWVSIKIRLPFKTVENTPHKFDQNMG